MGAAELGGEFRPRPPGGSSSRCRPGRWPTTAASVTAASSWSGSVNVVPQSLISKQVNAAGSKVSAIVSPANGGRSRSAHGYPQALGPSDR